MKVTSLLAAVRDDAIDVLMEHWGLSRHAAAIALSETAGELAVDIDELAALISANAARRQRTLTPVLRTPGPPPQRPSLTLVDSPMSESGSSARAPQGDTPRTRHGRRDPSARDQQDSSRLGAPRWLGHDRGLTRRESQVLTLIVAGLSNQTIADQLYLSINSIKSHVHTLYPKMGVKTRSQAVVWGIDHGFRTGR